MAKYLVYESTIKYPEVPTQCLHKYVQIHSNYTQGDAPRPENLSIFLLWKLVFQPPSSIICYHHHKPVRSPDYKPTSLRTWLDFLLNPLFFSIVPV